MITRPNMVHAYAPTGVPKVGNTGAIRVTVHRGIPQTWAVARPTGGYDPVGAPFYITGNARPNGLLLRSGSQAVQPAKPNVEMDPSDPTTWQRDYQF